MNQMLTVPDTDTQKSIYERPAKPYELINDLTSTNDFDKDLKLGHKGEAIAKRILTWLMPEATFEYAPQKRVFYDLLAKNDKGQTLRYEVKYQKDIAWKSRIIVEMKNKFNEDGWLYKDAANCDVFVFVDRVENTEEFDLYFISSARLKNVAEQIDWPHQMLFGCDCIEIDTRFLAMLDHVDCVHCTMSYNKMKCYDLLDD